MDFNVYPYPSKRYVKYGINGMCATSNHLAAQAGLDTLKKGGNAFDAAIAMATCLTVLEPQSNGIGGDAYAILTTPDGKMYGLNSTGCAPELISAQKVKDQGLDAMPKFGFTPVTVPGIPAAWAAVNSRFGKLPLTEVMKPAITYANEGQAVSYKLSQSIKSYTKTLEKNVGKENEFKFWHDTFMPDGRAPEPGEIFCNKGAGRTLELIANSNAEEFYKGELADKIDAFSKEFGGYIRKSDLEKHEAMWVEPVSARYRGYDVWEIPPNGQGIVALMALNILNNFEPHERDNIESIHREIEAIKIAFSDGQRYITDPRYMKVKTEDLISPAYGAERAKLIGKNAILPEPGILPRSGTVYLCAADGEGNMISYIQSNYMGFGSGLVVPGTGIQLQNRGNTFSLDENHDNYLLPGKRTYHTIIPGFLTKDGKPVGPFGVMGGFMQPQGHVQVIRNFVDCNMNPQACLDAPRWQWMKGMEVTFERGFGDHILEALKNKGHEVRYEFVRDGFGRGQMIFRTPYGTLMGGTEPRCEGECATW